MANKIVTVERLSTFLIKIKALINQKSKVSFTRSLTSGTKVGTINIDGVDFDLYCQTNTDTKYTHPSYTQRKNGLYKITVDATGHVSTVTEVTKSDITALGIPAQDTNTTYSLATQNASGLQSATDKKKLDGIAAGANAYVHPTSHPASMIQLTVGASTVILSDVIACAMFPIAEDDDTVTFGDITEWLAAGKPKI